ncbi:hypothetical protein SOQ11_002424 [Enterococcus faecalis]|nr:hypothetical protein [Enterococcus faecalis]
MAQSYAFKKEDIATSQKETSNFISSKKEVTSTSQKETSNSVSSEKEVASTSQEETSNSVSSEKEVASTSHEEASNSVSSTEAGSMPASSVTSSKKYNNIYSEIAQGYSDDMDITRGSPFITRGPEDWWWAANHIFTRKMIDIYLKDSTDRFKLGYKKGDIVKVPLLVLGSLDFSSGYYGRVPTNTLTSGEGKTFKELVPSMADKPWVYLDRDNNIPWVSIDYSDIPSSARESDWGPKRYRSAFQISDNGTYLRMNLGDVGSGPINDSVSYYVEKDPAGNAIYLIFERTKTVFKPEIDNIRTIYGNVSYEDSYNGSDSDYHNGSYEWHYRDKDSRKGSFSPKIGIKSEIPPILSGTQIRSIELPLGSSLANENINLNEAIKANGTVNGSKIEITSKNYNKQLTTIGEQQIPIQIKETLDGSQRTVDTSLSVNVKWGSTVLLKGYGDNSVGAVTLHSQNNDNILLTDTVGINRDSNESQVHSFFKGETYYDLRLLGTENEPIDIKKLKPVTKNNSLTYAYGDWDALQRIKAFGDDSSGKQMAKIGNILEVTHKEADTRERLIVNGKEVKENNNQKIVYYELTTDGFKPLRVNQLKSKKSMIPIYSTEKYLDEHIKDYIDLKGYSNISVKEFSQYPNTKVSGQQNGKIIVEETLTTGKKVRYEYEITFTIGEGTLTSSVPKTLTFKEFSKSKSEQVVQRKYSGDLGLKISDNRGQGKQGNWRLTAQVKQSEELSPYLIFRDSTSKDKYLNQGATEIYSQSKQSNPIEPLDVEVSGQWKKDTGILLKVPPKNNLSSKQYTSTITWNLVEGP